MLHEFYLNICGTKGNKGKRKFQKTKTKIIH